MIEKRKVKKCWRSPCGQYTVNIEAGCIERIVETANTAAPNEVGSALVGKYSDDGYTAWVEEPGPVTKDSRGSRAAYHRGVQGIGDFFKTIFRTSRGRRHYVGEWHSHPGGEAYPSGTDDETLTAICKDQAAGCAEMVLLLIGRIPSLKPDVGVFVYSRIRGRIRLECVTEASEEGATTVKRIQHAVRIAQ